MTSSRSSRLAAFDAWFDRLLEPTRNFKPTVWLFTAATALGDFGIGAEGVMVEFRPSLAVAAAAVLVDLTARRAAEAAERERNTTLARMVKTGKISQSQADAANKEPLTVRPATTSPLPGTCTVTALK